MGFKVLWSVFLLGNIFLTMADVFGIADQVMERDTKFHSPLARDKIANERRKYEAHNLSKRKKKIQREDFPLKLSLLYETSGKKNKWRLNRKRIEDAVKIVDSVFRSLHVKIVLRRLKQLKHQDLLPGTKSTDLLQRFINRGSDNDNTQLITDRTLESDSDVVGAATLQTMCLPGTSGGIIIERQKKNAHHLALVMTHNLACSMGILKKQFCVGVLREGEMRCQEGKKGLTNDDIRECIWKKLDPNRNRLNFSALCEENRSKRNVPKPAQRLANQEDKNNSSKLVLILAPLGAVLLLILAAAAAYKWKQNRDKTRLLKNRVSVKYHNQHETISPRPTRARPSIINDPTVTLDLEQLQ